MRFKDQVVIVTGAAKTDVTASADVRRAVEAVVGRWGRVDVLVNRGAGEPPTYARAERRPNPPDRAPSARRRPVRIFPCPSPARSASSSAIRAEEARS